MIYVMLRGRMCNQMFQMATAKSLSVENSTDFICGTAVRGITPSRKESDSYKLTTFRKIKFEDLKLMKYKIHQDPHNFSFKEISYENNILLDGYYQSEKYFKKNRVEILNMYECPEDLKKEMDLTFSELLARNDTCSVHIRRGDYLKYKENHTNLNKNYYEKCFNEKKNSHFVFFSDDIEWCKENFKNKNATFVSTKSDVIDFYLMSRMKNNIIANSSFSWWAAWLNKNENKHVLAPKRWFGPKNNNLVTKDLIPETWEIIDA